MSRTASSSQRNRGGKTSRSVSGSSRGTSEIDDLPTVPRRTSEPSNMSSSYVQDIANLHVERHADPLAMNAPAERPPSGKTRATLLFEDHYRRNLRMKKLAVERQSKKEEEEMLGCRFKPVVCPYEESRKRVSSSGGNQTVNVFDRLATDRKAYFERIEKEKAMKELEEIQQYTFHPHTNAAYQHLLEEKFRDTEPAQRLFEEALYREEMQRRRMAEKAEQEKRESKKVEELLRARTGGAPRTRGRLEDTYKDEKVQREMRVHELRQRVQQTEDLTFHPDISTRPKRSSSATPQPTTTTFAYELRTNHTRNKTQSQDGDEYCILDDEEYIQRREELVSRKENREHQSSSRPRMEAAANEGLCKEVRLPSEAIENVTKRLQRPISCQDRRRIMELRMEEQMHHRQSHTEVIKRSQSGLEHLRSQPFFEVKHTKRSSPTRDRSVTQLRDENVETTADRNNKKALRQTSKNTTSSVTSAITKSKSLLPSHHPGPKHTAHRACKALFSGNSENISGQYDASNYTFHPKINNKKPKGPPVMNGGDFFEGSASDTSDVSRENSSAQKLLRKGEKEYYERMTLARKMEEEAQKKFEVKRKAVKQVEDQEGRRRTVVEPFPSVERNHEQFTKRKKDNMTQLQNELYGNLFKPFKSRY